MSDTTTPEKLSHREAIFACATIIIGAVLGIAGIDLVLPSVPSMPAIFGTTVGTTQLVLASFVAGTTLGLLLFGSLAAHYGRRRLFIWSLLVYALISLACIYSTSIWHLIGLRFFQGAAASGAAVLAPGLIRGLFSDHGAMRALSAMGSIESLVPGLAPIAGAWIFAAYGWEASFTLTAVIVSAVCLLVIARPKLVPSIGIKQTTGKGSYKKLLKNKTYVRYALSHGLVVGGLLTFVFTAPAIIIETMGGTIDDFILMQMVGVSTFIVASNVTSSLARKWSVETMIMTGTVVCVLATFGMLYYALAGPNNPQHLVAIFWTFNVGVGLRGGPGVVRALMAAGGDDDRASALMILSVTSIAAIATAAVAPFIQVGLSALMITTCLIVLAALLLMLSIKPLETDSGPSTAD